MKSREFKVIAWLRVTKRITTMSSEKTILEIKNYVNMKLEISFIVD